jgi:hypothetical protein
VYTTNVPLRHPALQQLLIRPPPLAASHKRSFVAHSDSYRYVDRVNLWSYVFTAAGTLVVGLIGAFVSARLTRASEHKRWVRERRYDVYTRVLELESAIAMKKRPGKISTPEELDETDSQLEQMYAVFGALQVVGPEDVNTLGKELLVQAMSKRAGKKLDSTGAVATDLAINALNLEFTHKVAGVLRLDKG